MGYQLTSDCEYAEQVVSSGRLLEVVGGDGGLVGGHWLNSWMRC